MPGKNLQLNNLNAITIFDMSRRNVIHVILTGILLIYIIIMVPVTNRAERNDIFDDIVITVNDPQNRGFVRPADVDAFLGDLTARKDTLRRRSLNTLEIERRLAAFNRVESATCRLLNNGVLSIDVNPFDPVARVFDASGSVYVNADGKRVAANPAYHVDVPVVTARGTTDSTTMTRILPILRKIKSDPEVNALVSSLRIDGRGDIIIIPNVLGHVINFGDTTLVDNKFDRLRVFYRDVMPARGWNAFDSVSVKWAGRVIATKRDKTAVSTRPLADALEIDEILDDGIMSVDVDPNATPTFQENLQ